MTIEEIPVVDVTELNDLSKSEIIELFDQTQIRLIKFCMDLKADYNQRVKALQDEYRLHPEHIPQQCNSSELKWKKPGRPSLSDDVIKRVQELRLQGLTVREIADKVRISNGSVSNIINKS